MANAGAPWRMEQESGFIRQARAGAMKYAGKAASLHQKITDSKNMKGILMQIIFMAAILITLLHLLHTLFISYPLDLFEGRSFIVKWVLIFAIKINVPLIILSLFLFFKIVMNTLRLATVWKPRKVHVDSNAGIAITCSEDAIGSNCSEKEKESNTYFIMKTNKTFTIMAIVIIAIIVLMILVNLNVIGSPLQTLYDLDDYATEIGGLESHPLTSWYYKLKGIVTHGLGGFNEEPYKNYTETSISKGEAEADVLDNINNERYDQGIVIQQLKETSVINRIQGEYKGDKSPECSEIRNYDQCVNGVSNGICHKLDKDNCETATDSSGVQLCSYDTENNVCKTKKKYYDKPCQYNISENDICVPLFDTEDNFHQLLGKEYVNNEKNEIYFDKCSTLKVNSDICNAIEDSHSANEVYEMLINDMENGTKIKSKKGLSINLEDLNTREKISEKCNNGAEFTLCMKQENPADFTDVNGDDITIDPLHVKEYTINYGGSTDTIHVVIEDEEITNCSELTPSILKGDQTEDQEGYYQYVCKNPDIANDKVGKYCTITNSDDSQQVCGNRYSGLIENTSTDKGSVNYYNIVNSKACNLLGDRTVVKKFMSKVKNADESEKNVMACAENFPLKENAFTTDTTNQVYLDMMSIIKDDYSTKGFSTIYKSGDNKYMFPYQLSNPSKTFEDGSNYSMYVKEDGEYNLFKQYTSNTLDPKIKNDDLIKKVKEGNTILIDYMKAGDATPNEYLRDISISCSDETADTTTCIENCSIKEDDPTTCE